MARNQMRFLDEINSMEERIRKMEKEKRKVLVNCSHQNENGKLKLEQISGTLFQCKYCKTEFDMELIPPTELKDSILTLHNAIQQIRCQADVTKEMGIVRRLGELDYNIHEVAEFYERIVDTFGKGKGKKKKKKHRGSDIGGYSRGALKFM